MQPPVNTVTINQTETTTQSQNPLGANLPEEPGTSDKPSLENDKDVRE